MIRFLSILVTLYRQFMLLRLTKFFTMKVKLCCGILLFTSVNQILYNEREIMLWSSTLLFRHYSFRRSYSEEFLATGCDTSVVSAEVPWNLIFFCNSSSCISHISSLNYNSGKGICFDNIVLGNKESCRTKKKCFRVSPLFLVLSAATEVIVRGHTYSQPVITVILYESFGVKRV